MYFVNKEDIAFYRYAVAKVCFLNIFKNYDFIKDVPKSNCMWTRTKENGEKVLVSLFQIPTIKLKGDNKTECFYQALHFKNAKQKHENEYLTVLKLPKEFDDEYDVAFENAIRTPQKYYENIKDYQFFFDRILLKNYDANDYNGKWYKYYSEDTVNNNNHNVVDGNISFVDPNTFNDPFDVNCSFANNVDMRGLFRILCVAPSPYEILMWSYYSTDHKGYCIEYNEKDILNKILDAEIDGLCIIGNVDYVKKRPPQKSKLNSISFTEVAFYIKAAFSKFQEWSHEKEYRYVMLSDSFAKTLPYYSVQIPVSNIYCGICWQGTIPVDSAGNSINPLMVTKDSLDYKLF